MVQISVIIITKNRPKQLINCLNSITANTFKNYEIIVIDQSTGKNHNCLQTNKVRKTARLIYKKVEFIGKSKGLNLAIKLSSGTIIAFTDDDCLVDKNWLAKIWNFYKKNAKASGVFGSTFPYKPQNNKNLFCPAVFLNQKTKKVEDAYATLHKSLGQGNNMSIKKVDLQAVGFFKEWLGVGSIGFSAEDNEMIFRMLSHGFIFFTNPEIRVFHNRWITKQENDKQIIKYSCGMFAFYTYYLLQKGDINFLKLIKTRIAETILYSINNTIVSIRYRRNKNDFFYYFYLSFLEIINFIYGITIGISFSIFDRNNTQTK